jgi:RNA polymerase subunit RPABC4/transcription elongation factor Spt4
MPLATADDVGNAGPLTETQACEACGAPLEEWDKFCPACGTPHGPEPAAPESSLQADPALKRELQPAGEAQKFFRCKNCGAEVATDPQQRSYVCPFCDSTFVVEFSPQHTGRKPPEFVLPFAVTADRALELFQQWIASNGWFRPGDLKTAKIEEKLKGVYLPFWSFSMLAHSNWQATIGEYWYRTETYTVVENGKTVTKTRTVQETEWWDLSGRHHEYHSGYLVSASRGLPQGDAERIKPFHLAGLRRYDSGYLAGWLCEEYSIDRDPAEQICRAEFLRREDQNIRAFLPGDTYRGLSTNTTFSDISDDLILLPVYLLSYRYGDRLFRFMVNGQTGKIDGDKPISWPRVWAFVGVVLGALALVAAIAAAIASR